MLNVITRDFGNVSSKSLWNILWNIPPEKYDSFIAKDINIYIGKKTGLRKTQRNLVCLAENLRILNRINSHFVISPDFLVSSFFSEVKKRDKTRAEYAFGVYLLSLPLFSRIHNRFIGEGETRSSQIKEYLLEMSGIEHYNVGKAVTYLVKLMEKGNLVRHNDYKKKTLFLKSEPLKKPFDYKEQISWRENRLKELSGDVGINSKNEFGLVINGRTYLICSKEIVAKLIKELDEETQLEIMLNLL